MAWHTLVFHLPDITLDFIILQKQAALKEYRSLKKSSRAFCQTYLEELAEARAAVGSNNSRATKIRQLKAQETQWALARRIRHLYGQLDSGVTSVIAPDTQGNMTEMITRWDIEQAIIN